jgi:hypothetical protein
LREARRELKRRTSDERCAGLAARSREGKPMTGRVVASAIVPVTLKLIVSLLPLPAAQPLTEVCPLAAVIASRKAQIPLAPGSARELTVIVAARQSSGSASINVAISAVAKMLARPAIRRLGPQSGA